MKIAMIALGVVVVLGCLWALAFLQIIPAQKIADRSPGAAHFFTLLRLAKEKTAKAKPKSPTAASPAQAAADTSLGDTSLGDTSLGDTSLGSAAPAVDPAALTSQKAALDTEKEQLDAEKAILDKKLAKAAAAGQLGTPGSSADAAISPKLVSIYGAMSSDDLARIFAKLPDSAVVSALNQLDDRQAGKVLAALPSDRAARITALMNRTVPPTPATTTTAMAPQIPGQ